MSIVAHTKMVKALLGVSQERGREKGTKGKERRGRSGEEGERGREVTTVWKIELLILMV